MRGFAELQAASEATSDRNAEIETATEPLTERGMTPYQPAEAAFAAIGKARMVSGKVAEAVPAALVARTVRVMSADTFGVPLMRPVVAL